MASEDIDNFLFALKKTMVTICGGYRYKDGAFEAEVTADSAILDDLSTIISSPLLMTHEKSVFSQVKIAAINLRNMKARGEEPDHLRILNEGMCVMALDYVVCADCKARGQYKPPMMCKIIGPDGEVKETMPIHHENKVEMHKEGKLMMAPDAPKAVNQAQMEAFGDTLILESKFSVGCYAPVNIPPDTAPSTFESDVHARKGTKTEQDPVELTAEETPSLKSKKDGGIGGFGGSFEKNLKNDFL